MLSLYSHSSMLTKKESQSLKQQKPSFQRKSNLEKYDENAIHFYANLWQPILAMVDSGTYPDQKARTS